MQFIYYWFNCVQVSVPRLIPEKKCRNIEKEICNTQMINPHDIKQPVFIKYCTRPEKVTPESEWKRIMMEGIIWSTCVHLRSFETLRKLTKMINVRLECGRADSMCVWSAGERIACACGLQASSLLIRIISIMNIIWKRGRKKGGATVLAQSEEAASDLH